MCTSKINEWELEHREQALKLTPKGRQILKNSTLERRDSRTIVLIPKKKGIKL